MPAIIEKLWKQAHSKQDSEVDALASLILAAREDSAFRKRLIFVLRLPITQREPLVKTAVDEMRLRGESTAAQAAFATLATEDGARTALQLLDVA